MAEPTKPGHGAPQAPSALEDTLAAEPSLDPPDGPVSGRPLAPGQRYRLGAELGRGGMGRVVEAFDVQLGRTVAFKEVLPRGDPGVARRFTREVQLTARLEHPSIVPLYDAGFTEDGRPFYVMRRVSGRPLDQLMARATGRGERLTLLPALLAAIDAVAHAHRRGVIHRDLKPSNILVGELGETVVIDWGLAKVIGEDDADSADGSDNDAPSTAPPIASDSLRTQIGSVFGTPGFMAPEQARGESLDPRGDVYALGATLYQLLAGAPPHSGTSATEVIARTGSKAVTPVDVVAPGAPPELVAIVGKALAFDPAGRYPDAGALGEDVRRFLSGQLVAAHRYTPGQRFARFGRRHRAPLGVAALAAAAVAVLAWIAVHRIVQERDVADAARIAAADGRRAAEKARDEAARRADQLVVMHARGVLDTNPTHALAVLKQLPAGSNRLGEARGV
ncbi:MAG TPA: serine/threonine-protein kinase, partial [Kofleriaceae bacterium]|nr:serine/threonine-protein kinase [Kofleriaceae bacterium]